MVVEDILVKKSKLSTRIDSIALKQWNPVNNDSRKFFYVIFMMIWN